MLVPYWNTAMNPYWDPAASGIVVGWNAGHRRHHLYRAILEGITYEHRLAMDGVASSTGVRIEEHVVLGGGSRSSLWCQVITDVLGVPVARAASADATNLGAGVLAAYGAGWYPSVAEAARAMTRTTDRFEPDPRASEAYAKLYAEVYRHLFPATQPLIDRLTELSGEFGAQSTPGVS